MKGIWNTALWAAALAAGLAMSPANANTLVLDGPSYSDNFRWNNNGSVTEIGNATYQTYTAVQQQDKLFDNFWSSSPLAGMTMGFSFATVGTEDFHTVTFADAFGSAGPGTYTWGYDISVVAGSPMRLENVASDILQTVGSAHAEVDVSDNTNTLTYTMDFGQVGTNTTGTVSVVLDPLSQSLSVTETLTILGAGSDATGISNSFTQVRGVPESSTWALMGLGFAGLAFAGHRTRRTAVAIA